MSSRRTENDECTERVALPCLDKDFSDEATEAIRIVTEAESGTFVMTPGRDAPSTVTAEKEMLLSPDRLALGAQAEESRCGFIPGYSILGSLGQGGMGVVYQAIQERLQRVVALKVLTPAYEYNPEFIARFHREAMAVAKLNHPNVVTAYDYGEADGKFYLAIEYVEGLDGAELLASQGRLKEADAIAMARDAVLGLSHALAHGIIHRDIKPANLMLTSEANRDASGGAISGRLKVTDLGLAQIRENANDAGPANPDAGKIVGTPSYMSPEQSRGEPVDFRGDIYALGATLYHFVTGLRPFDDDDPMVIIRNKNHSKLVHPQDEAPELSDEFCLVLDRMLALKREDRHQSYEELLADLQALLAGKALATHSSPPSSTLKPAVRRRFKLFQPKQDTATPLPFELRLMTPDQPKSKLPNREALIRFLVPLAIGFALALIFF